MVRAHSGAPSQRQLRVAEEIRHALAWALERGEVRDPELDGVLLTVTEARVGPDLRHATIFIACHDEAELDPALTALRRAIPFLRHVIAKRVKLKFVPDLTLVPDESLDRADRITRLLHSPEVARDLDEDR